ncbi:MAG: hypothetical protein IT567_00435 [Alphaproteobacteria bacterium]|nr:hypothetical protein [Alphaproteobacteria bacterium]
MNLRIEGTSLRFRVTKEELGSLCAGDTLSSITPLPDGASLAVNIHPSPYGGGSNAPLTLQHQKGCLMLYVDKNAAADLFSSLPNREGIDAVQKLSEEHLLHLTLEVDIRSQKRKRP